MGSPARWRSTTLRLGRALALVSECARSTGWLVLSLDHPFARPLPSQKGGYFDSELVSETWRKATVEATQHFWRRPSVAVIEAFADAGFVIDRVAEPQPSPEALERFPGDLEDVKGFPGFIVYRLLLRLNEA